MKKYACAFTGHRPDRFSFGYDENDEKCIKLKAVMSDWITAMIIGGIRTFYSGMALGVDQWAAEIVLDMKQQYSAVRLIAVRPCETQADSWLEEQRERHYKTLAVCDEVITLYKHYTRSCMFERNRYLADHADYLLAVYNGGAKCGTAYTVNYAKQKHRQLTIVHPDTLAVESSTTMDAFRRRSEIKFVKGDG